MDASNRIGFPVPIDYSSKFVVSLTNCQQADR